GASCCRRRSGSGGFRCGGGGCVVAGRRRVRCGRRLCWGRAVYRSGRSRCGLLAVAGPAGAEFEEDGVDGGDGQVEAGCDLVVGDVEGGEVFDLGASNGGAVVALEFQLVGLGGFGLRVRVVDVVPGEGAVPALGAGEVAGAGRELVVRRRAECELPVGGGDAFGEGAPDGGLAAVDDRQDEVGAGGGGGAEVGGGGAGECDGV